MPGLRIGPEIRRHLLRRTQADIRLLAIVLALRPSCAARVAVDLGVEVRRVDFLLQMRVDDARNRRNAPRISFATRKVLRPVVAHGPHVDLRRQPEIQDLGHHVGRLEIERILGKCRRQHLTQLLDIVGGRRVAVLQRHLDDAVIDADGRTVGECQIVGPRRQADIVDDQPALFLRNVSRILSSTAWNICSVSSMRVPAGART